MAAKLTFQGYSVGTDDHQDKHTQTKHGSTWEEYDSDKMEDFVIKQVIPNIYQPVTSFTFHVKGYLSELDRLYGRGTFEAPNSENDIFIMEISVDKDKGRLVILHCYPDTSTSNTKMGIGIGMKDNDFAQW